MPLLSQDGKPFAAVALMAYRGVLRQFIGGDVLLCHSLSPWAHRQHGLCCKNLLVYINCSSGGGPIKLVLKNGEIETQELPPPSLASPPREGFPNYVY